MRRGFLRVKGRNMKDRKEWTTLIYLPQELGEQEKYVKAAVSGSGIRVYTPDKSVLRRENWVEEAGIIPQESLMIAASEESMIAAEEKNIPTLAYRSPAAPWWRFSKEPYVMEGFEEVDEVFLNRRFQRFYGIPWDIAETDRCLIRELEMEDLPALFELYQKPHVTDYMEALYSREEEEAYQKQYIEKVYHYYEFGMWLVFDKSSRKLIGRVGLEPRAYPRDDREDRPEGEGDEISVMELGYMISPDYQRRGLATEVCREVIRLAFEDYEAESLHCLVEPENIPSVRLAEKLGFDFIGKMHMDGRYFNHYILHADSCNFQKKNI